MPLLTKFETGQNTSSKFSRPRIFCLEHAIKIVELLQSEGGANVLVICHSGKIGFNFVHDLCCKITVLYPSQILKLNHFLSLFLFSFYHIYVFFFNFIPFSQE
jgi:hypothetical protein